MSPRIGCVWRQQTTILTTSSGARALGAAGIVEGGTGTISKVSENLKDRTRISLEKSLYAETPESRLLLETGGR